MNATLNQLLENITTLNSKLSNLVEAGDNAIQTSLAGYFNSTVGTRPEVCEELQLSLSPVIYRHLN